MLNASFIKIIVRSLALATLLISAVHADTGREYQLKAAYLLNFSRFVYWPVESFKTVESTFNICVYGENYFQENLDYLLNKKVQSRAIKTLTVDNIESADACQILFISDTVIDKFYESVDSLPKNILTVSDVTGFSSNGGMIEFVRSKNKIKFEINVVQSMKSGIKYRSQLLEVAERLR